MICRGPSPFLHSAFLAGRGGDADCPNPLEFLGSYWHVSLKRWVGVYLCRRCDEALEVGPGVDRYRYSTAVIPGKGGR